jgi:peptidoglycan/LPS O-acetylase OafA/YrhL
VPLPTYPALTSLRFLAALLVFLFHFPPHLSAIELVAREGHVGVNIFFVLSGFLIALRYAEAVANGRVRFRDYLVRRAARILPLYYVVLALSVAAAGGAPLFSMVRLPEWTLTQGLFRNSVSDLAVPTSWSLTVEEGFYLLAPLLFLAIAHVQRRWKLAPVLAGTVVAAAATALLYAGGAVIWTSLAGRGPGFLSTAEQVSRNTLFGRFYDFAVGVVAALAFPHIRLALERRRTAALATVCGAALIVVAQWGMHQDGGINGAHWQAVYAWHLLIAPAAAAVILSLTVAANPAAQLLAATPLVYLGKISYALYLIQATELAKSAAYRVVTDESVGSWLLVYLGMTAFSVVLYELVEEPAHIAVLRSAGLERSTPSPRRTGRYVLAATVSVLIVALGVHLTARTLTARHGTVTVAELQRAGVTSPDVLTVRDDELAPGRPGAWSIRIPGRWRDGWDVDDRAPTGLRVFVDGAALPFSFAESAADGESAFFRSPRAGFLALRLDGQPAEVVVVNSDLILEAVVFLDRLGRSPRECAMLAAFVLAAAALAYRLRR